MLQLSDEEVEQCSQGHDSHRLGYGMCHFFRVLFWLKNKFLSLFYSFLLNFWVKILALNKFLGQIVMKL